MMVDEKETPSQRGLDGESGDLAGEKVTTDEGADEMLNVFAEEVAVERD